MKPFPPNENRTIALCPQPESGEASETRVFEIDFRKDPRWNQFVSSHPDATIYHHSGWLAALEKENDRRCVALACEDNDGKLLGILPLLSTRGLPVNLGEHQTRRRLSSLPRTPSAGPLGVNDRATSALLQAAISLVALGKEAAQLEIKADNAGLEKLASGLRCLPWRVSYVLRLSGLADDPAPPGFSKRAPNPHPCGENCPACRVLRSANPRHFSASKRAVNKALNSGVRVRDAKSESELAEWHRLYLETMRRNAVPARSFRFFRELWHGLRPLGYMRLLLAEQVQENQTTILGGSIILQLGKTAFYAFNGCRRRDFALRPNDLLQWQSIHEVCKAGFQFYDLGEVPEGNESLADFKSRRGGMPKQLYRYYYPAPPHSQPRPQTETLPGRLGRAVWGHLPLRATELLGAWIYRYL